MIAAAEIERMSGVEKMEIMELLWRSMSAEPAKMPSPQCHRKILAQRLAKVEAGKGEFLTLTQLKKRLAHRRAWSGRFPFDTHSHRLESKTM
jgi:putative addiction module component (TIGR02574 family)